MYRKLVFSLCLVLFSVAAAMAQDKGAKAAEETKVANGTRGADEADGARAVAGASGTYGPGGSHGEPGVNGPDEAAVAGGAAGAGDSAAKTLSGMSVLGNDEAPMSLFIVPWKTSELGVETNLKRTLDERDVPVDRDVFMREIDFYQVSVAGETSHNN